MTRLSDLTIKRTPYRHQPCLSHIVKEYNLTQEKLNGEHTGVLRVSTLLLLRMQYQQSEAEEIKDLPKKERSSKNTRGTLKFSRRKIEFSLSTSPQVQIIDQFLKAPRRYRRADVCLEKTESSMMVNYRRLKWESGFQKKPK
ncbi:hypothetical protein TEQG_04861 [Trichophyton equinum CBS 127.97]|uniref:Uncharacterized protein n=1 Tax=Trichophyton equinum (strain ATCC MYA-4606 / CBS 127.97) TaxID=559882 RepID=F2PVD4_TRIEC|nr:hypothetical protein TEQG_04861 [Trichophyton equinum CBS 127.97]